MAGSTFAADLSVGLPPPSLEVAKWYKGEPVTGFDSNKTYVVEFWATWCGPCRESIPHLTELAKANKDVTFIGVSIWEDENGTNISKFVKDMGDKMDYHVGYSSNKDGMAKTWMAAAGQNGIPTAFVVKNDEIKWIGHPMELGEPLSQIKAETFDEAGFKAKFAKQQDAAREQMAVQESLSDIVKLYDGGKKADAKAQLANLVAKHPTIASTVDGITFGWLAKDDPKAWEAKATEMANSKDEAKLMNLAMFAMRQAGMKTGDGELAKKAIALAVKGSEGKDLVVLYYAGSVYTTTKDYKLALDATNACLKLLPETKYKDNAGLLK